MTQFTGKSSYLMGSSRQNRIPTSHENAHENVWEVSHPGQQIPDQVVTRSQSTRTVPLHKPSQQAFLYWVAFNRSFSPNIPDIVRRTCPLLECERCFDSWENMLNHLKECPRLSKAMYRCFETGREERIGRCETPGCLDLQRYKDRIANQIRRLSSRGYSPRRRDSIPLESLSPEPDVISYGTWSRDPAELPCTIADLPPAYSLGYAVEIGSGGHSTTRPTPFPYEYAELDVGEGSSQPHGYPTQPEPERVELCSNDDMAHAAQYVEPNRFGAIELSTDNNLSYSSPLVSAQPQQPHHSSSNFYNPQGRHNDWHQPLSMSNSPVSTYRCDSGNIAYEQAQQFGSFTTDVNGSTSSTSPYGYHHPPSTGSGVSTDDSWAGSGSSMISTPSRDTSMSSLEPHNPKTESSQASVNYFLGESNRMCAEPDEMEFDEMGPLHSHSTDIPSGHFNNSGSWDTSSDGDSFVKDFNSGLPPYPKYVAPHEGMQPHGQFQHPGNPVSPLSPSTEQEPWPFCPEIDYRQIQSPEHKSSHPTQVNNGAADDCVYCGARFKDKSNLARHEKRCKRNPHRKGKMYFCRYKDCGKGYGRSDALHIHQRNKGHDPVVELHLNAPSAPKLCRKLGRDF